MTRTKKSEPGKIVVSANRPQIRIMSNGDDHLRLAIPSVSRTALALAHAIVSAFLSGITDEQLQQMLAPTIAPGDRLLTCLVITVELTRFGAPDPAVGLGRKSAGIRRARIELLGKALTDAARRICTPLYGAEPAYDVVEVFE